MALREIIQRTKGLDKSVFVSTEPLIRQAKSRNLFHPCVSIIHLINQVDLNCLPVLIAAFGCPTFFFLMTPLNFNKPQIVFDHHPREGKWQTDVEDIPA